MALLGGSLTACTDGRSSGEQSDDGVAVTSNEGGSSDSEDEDEDEDEDGDESDGTSGQSGDASSAGDESDDEESDSGDDAANADSPLLPAGIRRLTGAEYQASVTSVFGYALPAEMGLPPDGMQDNFTRNHSQRVDPVLAKQLDRNAMYVAEQVTANLQNLAPCSGDERDCAVAFIEDYGAKAYRRPLEADEIEGLAELYDVGREEGDHSDGIALVVRGLLQAPGFLYVSELGEQSGDGEATLTGHELATSIAYLALSAPPDGALLAAAANGTLDDPEVRLQHFDRLLTRDGAVSAAVLRVMREWIGISDIAEIAKDTQVYPQFANLRAAMDAETRAFITEVIATDGTLEALLGADWTIAEQSLAQAYGVGGSGRVSLASTERRGILNQGAYLAVYAHAHESAPILRGVSVLRRLLCYPTPSPTALDLMIVPPLPDPAKTTRERFELHSADPACASCHRSIDNVGFTFEAFDGMGMARAGRMENGKVVDTTTELSIGLDVDGSFADSAALAEALSTSERVRECFARHMFRSAAARSGETVTGAEAAFVDEWKEAQLAASGHILETLRTYVGSDRFALRRTP